MDMWLKKENRMLLHVAIVSLVILLASLACACVMVTGAWR